MTTTTMTHSSVTVPIGPYVPSANSCLPAHTAGWSFQAWNSGRKVVSRVLGVPCGELTRPEQIAAVHSIQALHVRHHDSALLLIALHVTAHEADDKQQGEAVADAVSELAAMTEEGTLTGITIRFPASEQLSTITEIITHLRSCVSGLPAA